MSHDAPPILSPLDFAGIHGKVILVEIDSAQDIVPAINLDDSIWYAVDFHELKPLCKNQDFVGCRTDDIGKIVNSIQRICNEQPEININFVIYGIDEMDLSMDLMRRGLKHKYMLSILPSRLLRNCNVIVVSKRREIMLRELCAMHFNLMTEVH
jgi:hypothetical protein